MCSAAPSIGKGPSIQRPLSGHSGHGRTRCWPAPVVIDPTATLAAHCNNGFDAGFNPYQSIRLSR